MTLGSLAGLLLAFSVAAAGAQEMVPPRLNRVTPDWDDAQRQQSVPFRHPGVAESAVPVLLPFGPSGWQAPTFLHAGAAGYDAAFSVWPPESANLTFGEPVEVQITGSALLYELDGAEPASAEAPALEAEFPGIRRVMHEYRLRYSFTRFGVPYVVSIGCFEGHAPRYRLPTCKLADRVADRFLRELRLAGGTPQPVGAAESPAVQRPTPVSSDFTYRPVGRLLPGTSRRGLDGRSDGTVYSAIRFPLNEAPAFVSSQMFHQRGAAAPDAFPWRDNFCERRAYPVGQCPGGHGHQGQDIRPPPCVPEPGESRCRPSSPGVAVRDGAILRRAGQEAAYLVVNTAQEHLRFRYLHMNPLALDQDNVLSGRRVREGERIGQVGNFNRREGGTSYHLHFDIQVPTRYGWVFVNPYMTLVAAYERLIGARGEVSPEPVQLAAGDAAVVSRVARIKKKAKRPNHPRRR